MYNFLLALASVLLVLALSAMVVTTLSLPAVLTALHEQLSSGIDRQRDANRQASDELIAEVNRGRP